MTQDKQPSQQNARGKVESFLQARPAAALLAYSIPTTLLTLALVINAAWDQYILGLFKSDTMMLGVAAILPFMMTLQAVLGGGVSNIVNTMAGRFTAEDNPHEIKKTVLNGTVLLAVINTVLVVLFFSFEENLYNLLKLEPSARGYAHTYAVCVLLFSIIANLSTMLSAYMRGRVFPGAALLTLVVGVIGNVLFCWLAWSLFKNETAVMLGPVISSSITLAASILFLRRYDAVFALSATKLAEIMSALRSLRKLFDLHFLLRMGRLVFLTSLLPLFFTLPHFFYGSILAEHSGEMSSFFLIYFRGLNLVSMLGFGIAIAALSLTSYYRGSSFSLDEQNRRIRGLIFSGSLMIGLLVSGLLVWVSLDPRAIHGLFLQGDTGLSAGVLELCDTMMPALRWMLLLNALGLFYSFFYIALEKPARPVIVSAVYTLVIIPLYLYAFVKGGWDGSTMAWGLLAIYTSMVLLEILLMPVFTNRSGPGKAVPVARQPEAAPVILAPSASAGA